jgi:PAS domain S-box-containing protein
MIVNRRMIMTNILVVDDNELARAQLCQLMEFEGYQVLEAGNGQEALDIFSRFQPDLVLLDALMPVMDGFTCCCLLKALPDGEDTPVLMVTGLYDQASIEQAFAAGATDYITKPIKFAVLRQRVQRILQASRAMKELRQASLKAQLEEERLRIALEAAHMGTWEWDIQRNKLVYSEQMGPLFGKPAGYIHPNYEAFLNAIHHNDRDIVANAIHNVLQVGNDYELEFRVTCPDGSVNWISNKGKVYYDDNSQPIRMVGIAMDISERKRTRQVLEETTSLQQAILNSANYTIISTSVDGTIQTFNAVAEVMLGYSASELLGKVTPEIIHDPEEVIGRSHSLSQELGFKVEPGFEVFVAKARLGQIDEREWTYIRKDGTRFPVRLSVTALRDQAGNITGFLGIGNDITEQKEADRALLLRACQQTIVAELSQKALVGTDLTILMQEAVSLVARCLETDFSQVWEFQPKEDIFFLKAGFGWESELINNVTIGAGINSLAGYTLQSQQPIIVPDVSTENRFHIPEFFTSHNIKSGVSVIIHGRENVYGILATHTCQNRNFTRDDIYFLQAVATVISITIEHNRNHLALERQHLRSQLFADVTVKIRTSLEIDEILETSVKEVQKLVNADRVLILKIRSNNHVTVVKESAIEGISSVFGQEIYDPCFHENYIQQYQEGRINAIPDIEKADILPCHKRLLQQFGVRANLVVPILLSDKIWGLLIAHECNQPREWSSWEIELLRQLADQIGIALSQANLLEKETQQRLELSRSNDELQQFAFIASHDLQEPLRKIKAFSDRLKISCGEKLNPQELDYLQRMQSGAQRMQNLIEALLNLSRVTTRAQPFIPVNIKSITEEVLSDLEVRVQQTGALIELGELPTIDADPLQMRQLLQNLIGNALKFYSSNQNPVIHIYSETLITADEKEFCQLIVKDNGIGFDEKYLDRIFNVFQRLHGRSEYEGTGMGLAICRKICDRHQGNITAQSQVGQGAKFIVTLPINNQP